MSASRAEAWTSKYRVQGHEVADVTVGQLLLAEQLTEELEQASDGVVVALHAGGTRPEVRRDLHEQVDVPGEHRIDLDEVSSSVMSSQA